MAENKLIENEDFMKALASATSVEDIKTVCKEHNVALKDDVTDEEIQKILDKSDEISAEDLEKVSGGILISTAVGAVAASALAGGELAFLLGYAKKQVKKIFK